MTVYLWSHKLQDRYSFFCDAALPRGLAVQFLLLTSARTGYKYDWYQKFACYVKKREAGCRVSKLIEWELPGNHGKEASNSVELRPQILFNRHRGATTHVMKCFRDGCVQLEACCMATTCLAERERKFYWRITILWMRDFVGQHITRTRTTIKHGLKTVECFSKLKDAWTKITSARSSADDYPSCIPCPYPFNDISMQPRLATGSNIDLSAVSVASKFYSVRFGAWKTIQNFRERHFLKIQNA